MPVSPTYPGVYIEELTSSVRTITGVPTSIAAFVGPARRGPTDEPTHITSWAQYESVYGGLDPTSPLSYAVYFYYQNRGSEAEIVRIAGEGAAPATVTLPGGVVLAARNPGVWGRRLRVRVDHDTREQPLPAGATATLYNLSVADLATGVRERYLNVSTDPAAARALSNVLTSSTLVAVAEGADQLPDAHDDIPAGRDPFADGHDDSWYSAADDESGADGAAAVPGDYVPDGAQDDKTGIYQLLKTDIFTILCLPRATDDDAVFSTVHSEAAQLCVTRRAMLIVDPPPTWTSVAAAATGMTSVDDPPPVRGEAASNAAIYFPNLVAADPARDGVPAAFAPCGAVAGVWARTDVRRGIWKAPAGTDATLTGVDRLEVPMTDLENGRLNPLGVNCLRSLPIIGPTVWGTRTMQGADRLASQWKYVPIRRLALFIEESLFRGTQWVVFEPNAEPLWSSIRVNVGAFMNGLFRDGAFQGRTPREAYLVKCDQENNPQNDIDLGIVNIRVGFAPLKPAEFVIVQIQQLAGQLQV
jgi:phage tail sheath protein FI